MDNVINETRKKLEGCADEKYKKFHSGLCPGINNIIGVRVPELKKIAKNIVSSNNYIEYIEYNNFEYYEEIMIKGLIIGYIKIDFDKRLEYIRDYIPYIDNWAICDTFCSSLKSIEKNKEKMWDFIKEYLNSNEEFKIRFAVVVLLDYYIEEKYITDVLNSLDGINHQGYYVKMAIAWAISIAYIKFPEYTLKYLKNNSLDTFTYNKAIQKIIESYRVSKENKEIIRSMKRK